MRTPEQFADQSLISIEDALELMMLVDVYGEEGQAVLDHVHYLLSQGYGYSLIREHILTDNDLEVLVELHRRGLRGLPNAEVLALLNIILK